MHHFLFALALVACSSATYHAPASTGTLALPEPGARAVTIVRIPAPWYARNFIIRRKFANLVGEYERVAGLRRKYFTITEDREFGGIYLWDSRAAARAWFSPAWHERIRERYGADTDVAVFDAPFVVDGSTTLELDMIDRASGKYPARATLLLLPSDRGEAGLRSLAAAHGDPPGLVRAYFVTTGRELGIVALWANRDLADAQLDRDHLARWEAAVGAPASSARVTVLEAPVLLAN